MTWNYLWKLAKRSGFHPKRFVYEARIDALKSLSYEFESHDFYSEAQKVNAFIRTEPKP